MAAAQVIVPGAMPSRDANGRSLATALFFYEADSALSSPATLYTSSDLTTPHEFPILSDAGGRYPQIWADEDDVFDVAWVNAATGATIDTFSDISPLNDGVLTSVVLAEDAAERAEAAADTAEALLAEQTGEPFAATSTTSILIGADPVTLTLAQTGKLFSLGQTVVIASTASPANQMTGIITAYNSMTGSMTVDIAATGGAGTFAAWTVSLSSSGGVLSIAGETGVVTAAEAKAALAIASTDVSDFNAAVTQLAISFAIVL